MQLAALQLRIILWALSVLLKYQAWRHPAFRARLRERNLVAQIKARDEEVGRWYEIKGGRLRSGAGLRGDAMSWEPALRFRTSTGSVPRWSR